MLLILSPIVALILGLLMYVLASNPKLAEIGRVLFAVGALWLVYGVGAYAGPALTIGGSAHVR